MIDCKEEIWKRIRRDYPDPVVDLMCDEMLRCFAHGTKFNSDHEFWAVLKEELEEADEALEEAINSSRRDVWSKIRNDDDIADEVEDIRRKLLWALPEIVQCLCVIEKWKGEKNHEK